MATERKFVSMNVQLSRALGVGRTPIGEAMTLIKQLAPERRRSVISLRR
jgi:hypothetical protein